MSLLSSLWAIVAVVLPSPNNGAFGIGSWNSRDPDLRGPEHGLVGRVGSTRLRHGGPIRSLSFSPDGALLVSADKQGSVIVWETATSRVVRRWDLPDGIRGPVGFSADGERVIWSTGDGSIRSHNIRNGMEARFVRTGCPYGIRSLEAGRVVVTDLTGRNRTWDEATGQQVETVAEGRAADAASPCGRYEANFATESTLTWKDRKTGIERTLTPGDLRFARSGCARFSADARHLFVTEMEGGILRFDLVTGQILNHYKGTLPSPPDRIALSPNGSCLAVAAANRIRLVDVASGRERFNQPDSFSQPPAMRLSPDGRFLRLSGNYSSPREENWELATARRVSNTEPAIVEWHNGTPIYPRESADGRFRVTHGGDTQFNQFDTSILRVWNLTGLHSWSVKKGLPGRGGYAFAPDGLRLCVVEDKGLAIYDSATGRLLELLPYTTTLTRREWAGAVSFTPDGHTVVTAHSSGLAAWPLGCAGHAREIRFARGDTLEGREGLLTLAPDGRLAVVETDRFDWLVFEVNTLQERFRIPNRHRGPTSSFLFTRDGRYLIASNGDSTVTIHDLFAGAAPKPGVTLAPSDEMWAGLAGTAATAFQSMQQLARHSDVAVEGLRERIRPARPVPEQVDRFVRELDAPRYQKREIAQGELTRLAHASRPALLAASRTDMSPEMRQRVDTLLKATRGPDLSTEGICIARAVELLERLQTAKAIALLQEWSEGPVGDTLADAARGALARGR
ncbi:MAG TPA: WD40 repeat domain-containing protein [Gemmataceae bacterium]|jgi:WD40 repeat protein|nr:WD40 repeat domain-containing protein [Gemmataceae bacterium]